MARKLVQEMIDEIIHTKAYVDDRKIVRVDANANAKRIVYENVNGIRSYSTSIALDTDNGPKVFRFNEKDSINGIICKK